MHVLHYLAVEADSKDEATNRADNVLNESLESGGTWFDWFVVGGGRFTTPEGAHFSEAYNDTFDNTISYVEDQVKFYAILKQQARIRTEELERTLANVDLSKVKQAVNDFIKEEDVSASYDVYRYAEVLRTVAGYWNPSSYFYDVESYDCDTKAVKERIKNNPTQQFLVPIDFHF